MKRATGKKRTARRAGQGGETAFESKAGRMLKSSLSSLGFVNDAVVGSLPCGLPCPKQKRRSLSGLHGRGAPDWPAPARLVTTGVAGLDHGRTWRAGESYALVRPGRTGPELLVPRRHLFRLIIISALTLVC